MEEISNSLISSQAEQLCPECAKDGKNTKILPFIINSKESVYMCSSVKCSYPFGEYIISSVPSLPLQDQAKISKEILSENKGIEIADIISSVNKKQDFQRNNACEITGVIPSAKDMKSYYGNSSFSDFSDNTFILNEIEKQIQANTLDDNISNNLVDTESLFSEEDLLANSKTENDPNLPPNTQNTCKITEIDITKVVQNHSCPSLKADSEICTSEKYTIGQPDLLRKITLDQISRNLKPNNEFHPISINIENENAKRSANNKNLSGVSRIHNIYHENIPYEGINVIQPKCTSAKSDANDICPSLKADNEKSSPQKYTSIEEPKCLSKTTLENISKDFKSYIKFQPVSPINKVKNIKNSANNPIPSRESGVGTNIQTLANSDAYDFCPSPSANNEVYNPRKYTSSGEPDFLNKITLDYISSDSKCDSEFKPVCLIIQAQKPKNSPNKQNSSENPNIDSSTNENVPCAGTNTIKPECSLAISDAKPEDSDSELELSILKKSSTNQKQKMIRQRITKLQRNIKMIGLSHRYTVIKRKTTPQDLSLT